MTNPTPDQDPDPKKKDSLSEKLESLRRNEKVDGFVNYASSNTRDIIAYILMMIGIILLFTSSFYGGALIGIIFGLYFTQEIRVAIKNINDYIEQQGMVRSLIFGGLLLAFAIAAPSIFIGIALAIVIKQFLYPETV